ncbi:hypothetical protein [Moraxella caviae]|uniref:hypothetical protein n=1 Tax=Moraxella caviae TaxID=34060 RepID=UPI00117C1394|nr:hypothetical protein [Moraxella caviae]
MILFTQAFFAIRQEVSAASASTSIGDFFITLSTMRSYWYMYAGLLIMLTYLIFGLVQELGDNVLDWLGTNLLRNFGNMNSEKAMQGMAQSTKAGKQQHDKSRDRGLAAMKGKKRKDSADGPPTKAGLAGAGAGGGPEGPDGGGNGGGSDELSASGKESGKSVTSADATSENTVKPDEGPKGIGGVQQEVKFQDTADTQPIGAGVSGSGSDISGYLADRGDLSDDTSAATDVGMDNNAINDDTQTLAELNNNDGAPMDTNVPDGTINDNTDNAAGENADNLQGSNTSDNLVDGSLQTPTAGDNTIADGGALGNTMREQQDNQNALKDGKDFVAGAPGNTPAGGDINDATSAISDTDKAGIAALATKGNAFNSRLKDKTELTSKANTAKDGKNIASATSTWVDKDGVSHMQETTQNADGSTSMSRMSMKDGPNGSAMTSTSDMTMDANGNLTSAKELHTGADGSKLQLQTNVDDNGNVVTSSNWQDAGGNMMSTESIKDQDGNLVSYSETMQDTNGNTSTTTWSTDADGNVHVDSTATNKWADGSIEQTEQHWTATPDGKVSGSEDSTFMSNDGGLEASHRDFAPNSAESAGAVPDWSAVQRMSAAQPTVNLGNMKAMSKDQVSQTQNTMLNANKPQQMAKVADVSKGASATTTGVAAQGTTKDTTIGGGAASAERSSASKATGGASNANTQGTGHENAQFTGSPAGSAANEAGRTSVASTVAGDRVASGKNDPFTATATAKGAPADMGSITNTGKAHDNSAPANSSTTLASSTVQPNGMPSADTHAAVASNLGNNQQGGQSVTGGNTAQTGAAATAQLNTVIMPQANAPHAAQGATVNVTQAAAQNTAATTATSAPLNNVSTSGHNVAQSAPVNAGGSTPAQATPSMNTAGTQNTSHTPQGQAATQAAPTQGTANVQSQSAQVMGASVTNSRNVGDSTPTVRSGNGVVSQRDTVVSHGSNANQATFTPVSRAQAAQVTSHSAPQAAPQSAQQTTPQARPAQQTAQVAPVAAPQSAPNNAQAQPSVQNGTQRTATNPLNERGPYGYGGQQQHRQAQPQAMNPAGSAQPMPYGAASYETRVEVVREQVVRSPEVRTVGSFSSEQAIDEERVKIVKEDDHGKAVTDSGSTPTQGGAQSSETPGSKHDEGLNITFDARNE